MPSLTGSSTFSLNFSNLPRLCSYIVIFLLVRVIICSIKLFLQTISTTVLFAEQSIVRDIYRKFGQFSSHSQWVPLSNYN